MGGGDDGAGEGGTVGSGRLARLACRGTLVLVVEHEGRADRSLTLHRRRKPRRHLLRGGDSSPHPFHRVGVGPRAAQGGPAVVVPQLYVTGHGLSSRSERKRGEEGERVSV